MHTDPPITSLCALTTFLFTRAGPHLVPAKKKKTNTLLLVLLHAPNKMKLMPTTPLQNTVHVATADITSGHSPIYLSTNFLTNLWGDICLSSSASRNTFKKV
jgi:hypothetical protein